MIIQLENVNFFYKHKNTEIHAIKNFSLSIKKGEFIAIIGQNSSGKSTLAKLLNALFLPTSGKVTIDKFDTLLQENLILIRQKVGMVFQNPDNQIIGSTVEEDIAFGLENLGLPLSVMKERIEYAVKAVHLEDLKKASPHELSGGQKQRLAVAGVLAMMPEIIVLDEPTSLLDPKSVQEIIELIHSLNKQYNITIILITQNMEELVGVDRILILNEGKLFLDDTPIKIFSMNNFALLNSLGLELPAIADLSHKLIKNGLKLPNIFLNKNEMVEFFSKGIHDRS